MPGWKCSRKPLAAVRKTVSAYRWVAEALDGWRTRRFVDHGTGKSKLPNQNANLQSRQTVRRRDPDVAAALGLGEGDRNGPGALPRSGNCQCGSIPGSCSARLACWSAGSALDDRATLQGDAQNGRLCKVGHPRGGECCSQRLSVRACRRISSVGSRRPSPRIRFSGQSRSALQAYLLYPAPSI